MHTMALQWIFVLLYDSCLINELRKCCDSIRVLNLFLVFDENLHFGRIYESLFSEVLRVLEREVVLDTLWRRWHHSEELEDLRLRLFFDLGL